MTDAFVDLPADPARDRNEVTAALLLGIAATLTAVASFLGAGQDGRALEHFSRSNAVLNDANFYFNKSNGATVQDNQIYNDYRTALIRGEKEVASYLRSDMREELEVGVAWAELKGANATPFDEGSPYLADDEDGVSGDEAQDEADAEFEAAGQADSKGDQFGLSTILFALTLFFGGISTLVHRSSVTRALLGMGSLALLVGTVQFGVACAA